MTVAEPISRAIEQQSAADPRHSTWVMANAGSGKTRVLVDRVVRLLLDDYQPETILCLTFTKAAAAEMSLRLFNLLSSWITLDDTALEEALRGLGAGATGTANLALARRLFATAIETPGGLKIQTIHAFCEKILQLFPVESGLAPGFRVMDEAERTALLEEARHAALLEAAEANDDALVLFDDGVLSSAEALDELAKRFLSATSDFYAVLDPQADIAEIGLALRQLADLEPDFQTDQIENEIRLLDRRRYTAAARVFENVLPFGSYKYDVGKVLRAIAQSASHEAQYDALFDFAFTKDGEPRGKYFKSDTVNEHPDLCAWLASAKQRIVDLYSRHALSQKIDATLSVIRLMRRWQRHFLVLKQRRGLYDFDDLISRTRQLLQTSRAAQWVLYKLDGRLSHILVDEAQDTSPQQWDIITALADEFFAGAGRPARGPRTVFVVGDIKQSIYSFQGADTTAFRATRDMLRNRLGAGGQELKEVDLTVSYRSLPAVLEIVDAVFAKAAPATRGLKQDGDDRPHQPHRTREGEGAFELWPPTLPLEDTGREPWQAPVDRMSDTAPRQRLARHVAATIKSWIGRRLLVSQERAVEAGDILILLQKRGPFFEALLAELRLCGVPVAGTDRLRLQNNLAVKDLLALIQFILLPEDDLTLACVLKGPLMPEPLDDDDLIVLAHGRSGSLWQSLQANGRYQAAAAFLKACIRGAAEQGPHGFLAHLLGRSRSAIVARLGEEARDATDTLLDLALTYEREHGTSLAAFLHWFEARQEDVKRELGEKSTEVRLMTVHGAKGLESEIVILPDAADPLRARANVPLLTLDGGNYWPGPLPFLDRRTAVKPEKSEQWKEAAKDEDREERMRLLYVAMTRARDELYVAGAQGNQKLDTYCWYNLVSTALDANDCKVKPRLISGDHPDGDIRRWGDDPQWLDKIAKAHKPDAFDVPAWVRAVVAGEPRQPNWRRVTHLATGGDRIFDRAAAARGTAIHHVLENLSSSVTLDLLRQRLARQKLEPELAATFHRLVTAAETAPYFAAEAQAEAVIAGHIEGLPPVMGQIDRLVVRDDMIRILDFKSGPRPPAPPEEYLRQMAQYAALLAEAYPGRAIKAALLWTHDANLQPLDSGDLSRALDRLRREHGKGPA